MSKDYMAIISPQQVVAGTEIQATDVNNPINTITNLVNGNLSSDNIAAGGVSSTNLAQDSVTVSELADDAVGTSNIIDAAVTADKLSPDFVSALGDYSYDETATPFSWVDGAKIYRKVITFTRPTAVGVTNIPHGVADISTPISMRLITGATNATGTGVITGQNTGYSAYLNVTNIPWTNLSAQTAVSMMAMLEYTKVD
jgi:hypothetical protein